MPLRAVAGLIVACIAAEASAFASLPTRTAGIIAGDSKRINVQPSTSLNMMGKRKRGGGAKKKRTSVANEEPEAEGLKSVGGGSEEEEDTTVPRLVVMDLDYTLW